MQILDNRGVFQNGILRKIKIGTARNLALKFLLRILRSYTNDKPKKKISIFLSLRLGSFLLSV